MARERTQLAWNRSGLAVVACVAVLLRRIWPLHGTGQIVALACISAGALAWAGALSIGRAVSRRSDLVVHPIQPRRAFALTIGTIALALAGLILSIVSPS